MIPDHIISALTVHPDVAAATALMTTYVKPVIDQANPFLLVGLDPILDRRFRPWETQSLKNSPSEGWLSLIAEPQTVLISDVLARKYNLSIGDRIALEHPRNRAEFKVVGVLKVGGMALAEGGYLAITDIASFQEYTGLHGVVDRIDLVLNPATARLSLETVQHRLAATLPEDIRMALPSETRETGQAMMRAYHLNLSILSFASLFVGMFLVYSLVALNAASRRHELAALRSIGASPRLLFLLFMCEGIFLGLIGWIAAFPLGSFLVQYLLKGISRTVSTLFVRVHVDTLQLDGWEILLSFGVTVFISLLAALQPAREAMRVAPREALATARQPVSHPMVARRLAGLAVIMILLTWPISKLPPVGDIPIAGYMAILILFAGFALFSPYGLQKTGQFVSPILRRFGGVSAYLAGRYMRDSGTRTAVSVGALITAVALFAALVIMISSFRTTVELWVNQTVSGDLFVTTKLGSINRFRYPLSPAVIEGLKELSASVDLVPSRRFVLTHGNNFKYELDAMDLDVFLRHGRFVWVAGDPDQIQPRLISGEGVIVSEVFASRTGLKVGDNYRAQILNSRVLLPILGVVRDYRTNGGVVFYHLPAFQERFFDPGWSGVRLYFNSKSVESKNDLTQLRADIINRCGRYIDMVNGADLRRAVLRIFDETFAVTTVLLLIALIIAALGITTTLAVQILERTRQLNTLFAIGADYGQIRAMIFWEATLLVLAGETAGLLCGFILSYMLVYVINVQSFGWSFIYQINWGALGMSLPLIIATALLAALPAVKLVFFESPAMLLRE
jgi:putative ABC transport system permease protein